jgi:CheY-like chemotaxis protein
VRAGDFGVRLPLGWTGIPGTISEVFNEVVELNQRLNHEFERISRTVGHEGKIAQRVALGSASGEWATTVESVNLLVAALTQSNASLSAQLTELTQSHANLGAQLTDLTEMARDRDLVLTAVARGDLSQRVALDVDGRPLEGAFLRSGQVVNSMIQTLAIFADQVTTVAPPTGDPQRGQRLEAIALLLATSDVDAVLMEVMMPEMDGLTVIRKIRADPQFATLPILAVSAKAMKDDRDRCIEAGASDYISKPVDVNHLVGLLRVWLNRR